MDADKLVRLRNLLQSPDGELLLFFLFNKMSEYSAKANIPTKCIKGMGLLIEEVKDIENQYNLYLNNKE